MNDGLAFETFTADTWLTLLREGGGEVRLRSSQSHFDLTVTVCSNPSCTCEEVTLQFREWEASGGAAAMAFDVQVDLQGDREATAEGLGADGKRMAAIVAAGLSKAGRVPLRQALREHRRRLREVPQTIATISANGEMVPFAHVLAGGVPADTVYAGFLDTFEEDEFVWSVVDSICCAPACNCREVNLTFLGRADGDTRQFSVRVPIGGEDPIFNKPTGMSVAAARVVYATWEADSEIDRPLLAARYERARALAKEGATILAKEKAAILAVLAGGPGTTPPRGAARPSVTPPKGRREPCPCGSGKRYKNCCGEDVR